MAWLNYQRILDGTSVSGKFGESLQITEKWQIRTDSPATSKAAILVGVSTQSGVTWGSSHFEFGDLKAMEFELTPDGKEGLRWTLTVKYYVPKRPPQANGLPADLWERSGGTTTVPLFVDVKGKTITNSAKDPLEGLQKEREEVSWSLTKCYENDGEFGSAASECAGKVNDASWSNYPARTVKCYFKSAKKVTVSKLDGVDDGDKLSFIESQWEFRHEPDTWDCKPWDVGFMELDGSERKAIVGKDGKPVKQPVALDKDGKAKPAGEKPDVINDGDGVEIYEAADFASAFGTPSLLS